MGHLCLVSPPRTAPEPWGPGRAGWLWMQEPRGHLLCFSYSGLASAARRAGRISTRPTLRQKGTILQSSKAGDPSSSAWMCYSPLSSVVEALSWLLVQWGQRGGSLCPPFIAAEEDEKTKLAPPGALPQASLSPSKGGIRSKPVSFLVLLFFKKTLISDAICSFLGYIISFGPSGFKTH